MKVARDHDAERHQRREDAPVREVARMLDRHHISGVPVCDGNGHMVGLISEYDLIAKPDAHTAGEAMTRDVISVMEDTGVDRCGTCWSIAASSACRCCAG